MSPDEALARLIAGNQRFIVGFDEPDSFKFQNPEIEKEQCPYACILGCADSRISPEHVFDESHGNLFVTRVAGNFVTSEILASLEYGASVLGAAIILVLGHSGCGAVGATIQAVSADTVFDGHIHALIDALKPAVVKMRHHDHDQWKHDAIIENVLENVARLKSSAPILGKLVQSGQLKIVGGIYNLESGIVTFLEV